MGNLFNHKGERYMVRFIGTDSTGVASWSVRRHTDRTLVALVEWYGENRTLEATGVHPENPSAVAVLNTTPRDLHPRAGKVFEFAVAVL